MAKIKLNRNNVQEERESSNNDIEFILSNLPIDKFKLEEEACLQVELMGRISRILPKAREMALRAKNRLEIIESELGKEIRKTPKNYGLDKTSDAVISREVKCQAEYKKAFSAYLFCKSKEDEYSIILNNVQERGRMIKILVELWMNNYYVGNNQFVTKKKKPMRVSED